MFRLLTNKFRTHYVTKQRLSNAQFRIYIVSELCMREPVFFIHGTQNTFENQTNNYAHVYIYIHIYIKRHIPIFIYIYSAHGPPDSSGARPRGASGYWSLYRRILDSSTAFSAKDIILKKLIMFWKQIFNFLRSIFIFERKIIFPKQIIN